MQFFLVQFALLSSTILAAPTPEPGGIFSLFGMIGKAAARGAKATKKHHGRRHHHRPRHGGRKGATAPPKTDPAADKKTAVANNAVSTGTDSASSAAPSPGLAKKIASTVGLGVLGAGTFVGVQAVANKIGGSSAAADDSPATADATLNASDPAPTSTA